MAGDTVSEFGPPALDHVQVAAPPGEERAARGFYGTLLGLPEVVKPATLQGRGGVWFALAGAQLHVGVVPDGFTPALKAHPALRWGSIEALRAVGQRLADAGVAVQWDGALPGVERFFCSDPWGNRLELLASPFDAR